MNKNQIFRTNVINTTLNNSALRRVAYMVAAPGVKCTSTCWQCGARGHLARNCPQITCRCCNGNHAARACPTRIIRLLQKLDKALHRGLIKPDEAIHQVRKEIIKKTDKEVSDDFQAEREANAFERALAELKKRRINSQLVSEKAESFIFLGQSRSATVSINVNEQPSYRVFDERCVDYFRTVSLTFSFEPQYNTVKEIDWAATQRLREKAKSEYDKQASSFWTYLGYEPEILDLNALVEYRPVTVRVTSFAGDKQVIQRVVNISHCVQPVGNETCHRSDTKSCIQIQMRGCYEWVSLDLNKQDDEEITWQKRSLVKYLRECQIQLPKYSETCFSTCLKAINDAILMISYQGEFDNRNLTSPTFIKQVAYLIRYANRSNMQEVYDLVKKCDRHVVCQKAPLVDDNHITTFDKYINNFNKVYLNELASITERIFAANQAAEEAEQYLKEVRGEVFALEKQANYLDKVISDKDTKVYKLKHHETRLKNRQRDFHHRIDSLQYRLQKQREIAEREKQVKQQIRKACYSERQSIWDSWLEEKQQMLDSMKKVNSRETDDDKYECDYLE